jgi:hypothetical protein
MIARGFVRPAAWQLLHRVSCVDEVFALLQRGPQSL